MNECVVEKVAFNEVMDATSLNKAHQANLFGNKACNLCRLHHEGFSVPKGFVFNKHYLEQHLIENNLSKIINHLLEQNDYHSAKNRTFISNRIYDLIVKAPLSQKLISDLKYVYEKLSSDRIVVRSSAIGEDSDNYSFAGQLDSILHIDSLSALLSAIKQCWASYWSERVLDYQHLTNHQLDGMAIIVQQQIDPWVSGVLFTRHPLGETHHDKLLIEYVYGLSESLVQGEQTPGRTVINRNTLETYQQESPEFKQNNSRDFDPSWFATLSSQALEIEASYGNPQDIEWVIDKNRKLYFVQTRPVTHSETNQPEKQSWTNANVNENFPYPLSPFLYSFAVKGYHYYFENLAKAFGVSKKRISHMQPYLRQIIGAQNGRMYYNLSHIHSVLYLTPFGKPLTKAFNEFVGTELTPLVDSQFQNNSNMLTTITHFFEKIRILVAVIFRYFSFTKRVDRFEYLVDHFASKYKNEKIRKLDLFELNQGIREFLEIRFHQWINASLADTAAMVCYAGLKGFLKRYLSHSETDSLHHALLKGIPNIVSNLPTQKIWELSSKVQTNPALLKLFDDNIDDIALLEKLNNDKRFSIFNQEFKDFLLKWGFRCSGELTLTQNSFQEEPTALVKLVRHYINTGDVSPFEQFDQQYQQSQVVVENILIQLRNQPSRLMRILLSLIFKRLVTWTHKSIRYRERVRFKQAALYNRLKHIALALGTELKDRDFIDDSADVFFLHVDEINEVVHGSYMHPGQIREIINIRKSANEEFNKIQPEDNIQLIVGEYYQPTTKLAAKDGEKSQDSCCLQGVAASSGQIRAQSTILESMLEVDQLQGKPILVTRQTDPGWGPAFYLISGLVLERGGMLSHGAILAREFGIPTVVGVKNATKIIPPGSSLHVDGNTGIVSYEK
ncbi:MAG: PEP-utilizing enzyme [Gammaproteobacteria bacterium]|nr:PEP-utilizing enzyme [Gammaproteobacteria bacterium]